MSSQETSQPTWTVYIIESESGTLYTGITTDLERRYQEHASDPKKGARFFRTTKPARVAYTETHPTRSSASKREVEIKHLSRQEKLALIESQKVCRKSAVQRPLRKK